MAETTSIITGNLTDDPEVEHTPGGIDVAHFTVAVTERRRSGDTWTNGTTSFFSCNAWRQLATHAAQSLSKGDRVIVVGRLRQRSWETEGGQKRSVIEVEADELGPSLRWATATIERSSRSES